MNNKVHPFNQLTELDMRMYNVHCIYPNYRGVSTCTLLQVMYKYYTSNIQIYYNLGQKSQVEVYFCALCNTAVDLAKVHYLDSLSIHI